MSFRPAPLFPVSLAFAGGALLGLVLAVPPGWALGLVLAAGLAWWGLGRRREGWGVALFYLGVLLAGFAHARLTQTTLAPHDVRALPEERTLGTTQWRGVLVDEPQALTPRSGNRRALDRTAFTVAVEAWRPTGGQFFGAPVAEPWRPAEGKVHVLLLGPADGLACGDRIEFAAGLEEIPGPLTPGALDLRAWDAERGIHAEAAIEPGRWQKIATAGIEPWARSFALRARDWAYARLRLGLEDDPRTADFLAGMLIGYREQVPADLEQDFRRTGTLHIFAVSGQNVAELVAVATIVLQLFGFVRWRWAWTLAPLVLTYCLLTGSPASAVRATVMALGVLLAWRLGRPLHALACWSLAFLMLTAWNPAFLLDPGAQLSFAVVLALILLTRPLADFLGRPFRHDPLLPASLLTPAQRVEEAAWRGLALLLGSGIAAMLASEPIAALAFHQVTPVTVPANLVVVPLAGLITIVGTLSVALSLVSASLAALFNNANWLFAKGLILFVGFLAHQPGAAVNVPDPRALASPRPSFVVAPLLDSACLLVRDGRGGAWLFNAGRESQARNATARLLQFYGVNRLEALGLLQLSAPDNEGAARIARDFHPRRLVEPVLATRSPLEKTLPELARQAGAAWEPWREGEVENLGPGVTVEVLHPAVAAPERRAEDRALVLLFRAGGGTLLWAGKITPALQAKLAARYPALHADVLVLGADTHPAAAWLRRLGARHWLQIPARERGVNQSEPPGPAEAAGEVDPDCRVWPLERTGSVEVHFHPAAAGTPGVIELQPWCALPPELAVPGVSE